MIEVKKLAHSRNPRGSDLISLLCTYPRFIHAEVMTHRLFSRNAASSRAIPLRRMIEAIEDETAYPEYWGAEQKGMQTAVELKDESDVADCKWVWRNGTDEAISTASHLHRLGLHKSICNRVLEPFSHITTLITGEAAAWANFFAQRAHPAAEPTFQVLAYRILNCILASSPAFVEWGGWHIPAFDGQEWGPNTEENIALATAHCARLSYLTHEGVYDRQADLILYYKLIANKHWSPLEHSARADDGEYPMSNFDFNGDRCGWKQYRKTFLNEMVDTVNLYAILAHKPDWITL